MSQWHRRHPRFLYVSRHDCGASTTLNALADRAWSIWVLDRHIGNRHAARLPLNCLKIMMLMTKWEQHSAVVRPPLRMLRMLRSDFDLRSHPPTASPLGVTLYHGRVSKILWSSWWCVVELQQCSSCLGETRRGPARAKAILCTDPTKSRHDGSAGLLRPERRCCELRSSTQPSSLVFRLTQLSLSLLLSQRYSFTALNY